MPLLATPTTTDLLADAFRAAIEAVVPRMQQASGPNRWAFLSSDRQPSQSARYFTFEWTYRGITPRGFMWRGGASVDVLCDVITDYGGIDPKLRDHLAEDDHHQLADVLDGLRRTTPGLCRVRTTDWGEEATDRPTAHQAKIVHRYLVSYLKARATTS